MGQDIQVYYMIHMILLSRAVTILSVIPRASASARKTALVVSSWTTLLRLFGLGNFLMKSLMLVIQRCCIREGWIFCQWMEQNDSFLPDQLGVNWNMKLCHCLWHERLYILFQLIMQHQTVLCWYQAQAPNCLAKSKWLKMMKNFVSLGDKIC